MHVSLTCDENMHIIVINLDRSCYTGKTGVLHARMLQYAILILQSPFKFLSMFSFVCQSAAGMSHVILIIF